MAKSLGDKFKDALQQAVDKASGSSINDFGKAVDSLYRNVSTVATLFRGSELVSSLLVRDQLSSTVFNSTTGWQIKGDGTATFRSVTISGGSLLITNTTDRIYLQSDGDAFFGSDISAPATTSFSIFSNAQTYNSESMGAGDVLFGDNSSGKANLLWDVSEGKILFRGGTTTQGYVNTDGAAVFAGTVMLDQAGISITEGTSESNVVKWTAPPGITAAHIGGSVTGTTPTQGSILALRAQDEADAANQAAHLSLSSPAATGGAISMCIDGASATNAPSLVADISLSSTGTVGAGFGPQLRFRGEGASGTEALYMAAIDALWVTATEASRAARLVFSTNNVGASSFAERLSLSNLISVFNDTGEDIDLRVEGDTATSLLVCDAGLDAVQIGTTTAGVILDARSTGVIINDAGAATIDFTVEGDTEAQLLFVDASEDKVYYKGTEIGTAGAGGVTVLECQVFS